MGAAVKTFPSDYRGIVNVLSNGGLRWMQRYETSGNYSITLTGSYAYHSDRWAIKSGGNWTGGASAGSTNGDNYGTGANNFYLEDVGCPGTMNLGGTATDSTATVSLRQRIESQVMRQSGLPGKKCTLTFFCVNQCFGTVTANLRYGNGLNDFSSSTLIESKSVSLTSLGSISGENFKNRAVSIQFDNILPYQGINGSQGSAMGIEVELVFSNPTNIGVSKYAYVTGFMLTAGSFSPDRFVPMFATPELELRYLKRFFQRLPSGDDGSSNGFYPGIVGAGTSSNAGRCVVSLEVPMRAAPVVTYGAAASYWIYGPAAISLSGISSFYISAFQLVFNISVASGLSVGQAFIFGKNNTSSAITLDAEI